MRSQKSFIAALTLFAALALPVHAQIQPLTWTVTSPQNLNAWQENIGGIAFGNGRFLASSYFTGVANGARLATSPDLVTWTTSTLPPGIPLTVFGQEYYIYAAAFDHGMFAVGAWGAPVSNTQKLLPSSDNGATWTPRDVKLADAWGLDYVNGLWTATGNTGPSGFSASNLSTSTDGITWTNRATGSGGPLNAAPFGNGRDVAVGNNRQVVPSPATRPPAPKPAGRARGGGADSRETLASKRDRSRRRAASGCFRVAPASRRWVRPLRGGRPLPPSIAPSTTPARP